MHSDRSNVIFWLDNICSKDLGIKICDFPTFSAAKPRTTSHSIPGRNGDLICWDGSFKNVKGKIKCFALDADNVDHAISQTNQWMADCKYKKLVVSSEPGRYRMARVTNAAEVSIKMGVLSPFELEFDCKPQRFFDNESPIRFGSEGGDVHNNTGFDALPLIRLHFEEGTSFATSPHIRFQNKNGAYRLIITPVGLATAKWVDIDLEKQCATANNGEHIPLTADNGEFPSFSSGVTSVYDTSWAVETEIFPRWWTL